MTLCDDGSSTRLRRVRATPRQRGRPLLADVSAFGWTRIGHTMPFVYRGISYRQGIHRSRLMGCTHLPGNLWLRPVKRAWMNVSLRAWHGDHTGLSFPARHRMSSWCAITTRRVWRGPYETLG